MNRCQNFLSFRTGLNFWMKYDFWISESVKFKRRQIVPWTYVSLQKHNIHWCKNKQICSIVQEHLIDSCHVLFFSDIKKRDWNIHQNLNMRQYSSKITILTLFFLSIKIRRHSETVTYTTWKHTYGFATVFNFIRLDNVYTRYVCVQNVLIKISNNDVFSPRLLRRRSATKERRTSQFAFRQ